MYLELLRRDYKVTVGRTGDKAIDFVCDKSGEKLYVQVAYLLASDETVQREFGAYNNIREYYGAAEPPVRCGESHLSGLTEPLHFVY